MTNKEAIEHLLFMKHNIKEHSKQDEALNLAIKALEERPQGEWVPVSEGLPDEETDVLICNKDGEIEVSRGSYSTEMKDEFIWYTSGWRFGKVIAWQPLPEPYRKGEEE